VADTKEATPEDDAVEEVEDTEVEMEVKEDDVEVAEVDEKCLHSTHLSSSIQTLLK